MVLSSPPESSISACDSDQATCTRVAKVQRAAERANRCHAVGVQLQGAHGTRAEPAIAAQLRNQGSLAQRTSGPTRGRSHQFRQQQPSAARADSKPGSPRTSPHWRSAHATPNPGLRQHARWACRSAARTTQPLGLCDCSSRPSSILSVFLAPPVNHVSGQLSAGLASPRRNSEPLCGFHSAAKSVELEPLLWWMGSEGRVQFHTWKWLCVSERKLSRSTGLSATRRTAVLQIWTRIQTPRAVAVCVPVLLTWRSSAQGRPPHSPGGHQ